jgi:hypothetical protein
VCEVCHEQFGPDVAAHVLGVDADAFLNLPFIIVCRPRQLGRVLNRSIPPVLEEEVGVQIVGDVEINPTVTVQVGPHHAAAVPVGAADARGNRNVGESRGANVAIEGMRARWDRAGRPVGKPKPFFARMTPISRHYILFFCFERE